MKTPRNIGKHAAALLAALVLLLFFWGELAAIPREAPTVDEQAHLARGLTYARTNDLRLYIGHPPLINLIAAWPLLFDPRIQLPLTDPTWKRADWIEFSITLFWKMNNPALAMFAAGRMMIALLGVLLLAGVYRLAADVGAAWQLGPAAGLVTVSLAALDPNLRAHARLVTTDIGVTLMLVLTVWLWRRWLRRPRPALTIAAGAALGLALASKFTALLFGPPLVVAALVAWGWKRQTLARLAAGLAITAVTVWAIYGFQLKFLPGSLLFPADYWGEFRWSLQDVAGAPAYLFGDVRRTGFYTFFLVALAVKLPLPLLLSAGLGFLGGLRRAWRREIILWLPGLTFLAIAIGLRVNIGLRHLLPIFPVLIYLAGALGLAWLWRARGLRRWAASGLAAWLLVNTALIYPRDLTFFNELAGGPDNGYRILVDSNLDWGQDLGALVAFVRERHIKSIYVSYFGSVPIGSFPVKEYPLPARPLPPRPVRDWRPLFPAPGWYAISVTHLMGGAVLDNPDTFAYFRHRLPVAILGRTIYIYNIPADRTGAVAACANPPPWMGENQVRRIFGAALTRLVTFDCARGLPLPVGPTWYLLRGEQDAFAADALTRLGATVEYDEPHHLPGSRFNFKLYRLAAPAAQALTYPEHHVPAQIFGGLAALIGYRYAWPLSAGQPVLVETVWQLRAPLPQPASIFLHLAAPDGYPLAISDGLNTPFDQLRAGDALIQYHPLDYPADLPAGAKFSAGFYPLAGAQARYRLPDNRDSFDFRP